MGDVETFSAAGFAARHPLAAAAGRDVLIEGGSVVEMALATTMVSALVVPDHLRPLAAAGHPLYERLARHRPGWKPRS